MVHPITIEQLKEGLTFSRGLISPARRYLLEKYGGTLDRDVIQNRIKQWDLQEWVNDLHKDLVEDCLGKKFMASLEDGNSLANTWVLSKYGHHAHFLKMREDESTQVEKKIEDKFDSLMNQISLMQSDRKIEETNSSEESKS